MSRIREFQSRSTVVSFYGHTIVRPGTDPQSVDLPNVVELNSLKPEHPARRKAEEYFSQFDGEITRLMGD